MTFLLLNVDCECAETWEAWWHWDVVCGLTWLTDEGEQHAGFSSLLRRIWMLLFLVFRICIRTSNIIGDSCCSRNRLLYSAHTQTAKWHRERLNYKEHLWVRAKFICAVIINTQSWRRIASHWSWEHILQALRVARRVSIDSDICRGRTENTFIYTMRAHHYGRNRGQEH